MSEQETLDIPLPKRSLKELFKIQDVKLQKYAEEDGKPAAKEKQPKAKAKAKAAAKEKSSADK